MRISIELVPRSKEGLLKELELVKTNLDSVNTINVPDLLRFDLRSIEACALAKNYYSQSIPHLRAIDYDLNYSLPFTSSLKELEISEVVAITGDKPADLSKRIYPTDILSFIQKIKNELPDVKVYAALDPYRKSFVKEIAYVRQKLEAGAAGLFTQPFFDVRLMEIYAELLGEIEVFWGVTTVTTKRSQRYWQTRNNAIFPKDFESTLEWNRDFAREAFEFCKSIKGNVYFMPIRADVLYLKGIL